MNIDPDLITRCAAAGAAAARSNLYATNETCMWVTAGDLTDQPAREAYARAVIETYMHSSSPGDLMEYIDSHPDIRDGEVFADAVLRLLRERDELAVRVEELEWRPVTVPPTRADADRRGFVSTLSRTGSANDHSVDLYDRWENVTHWRPYTTPSAPAPLTFDQWWATATEEERRVSAQRDWDSTRACKK